MSNKPNCALTFKALDKTYKKEVNLKESYSIWINAVSTTQSKLDRDYSAIK